MKSPNNPLIAKHKLCCNHFDYVEHPVAMITPHMLL